MAQDETSEVEAPAQRSAPGQGLRALLLYSGLPEGLIAVAVLAGTSALLRVSPSAPLLVLGFCGTLLVYLADRALGLSPEDAFNRPVRLAWTRRHRRGVWGVALVAALVALATLPLLRRETLGAGAVLGAVGFAYVTPVLWKGRRLKSVWYLKPVAIGAAWALGGVVLPVVEAGAPLAAGSVWALAAYRALIVGANALVADWGDRRGDARAGLRTAATEWTPRRLRRVATGALGVAVGGGIASVLALGAGPLVLVDLAGPLLLIGWIRRSDLHARWYRGLVLDALVGWPAVTALAAWLFF